ncbi:PHP domain-containing protein [Clostridium polynesiense]|uniref:PHP domain-containing protein n=1 Tax=Clostridium polynesiense TaxID=1325933 RepID=UPI0005915882|nr:PHP domain-containing protein [Clostridium polynesiense]
MDYKVELHAHSTASDGSSTPSELAALAYSNKIQYLALTDHDTTDGVKEAMERGRLLGIEVIPGIELSTIYNNESIHVLGYFKDSSYQDKDFQSFLKEMQDYRIYRAKKIIDNLKEFFNIKLDYDEVFKKARGVIARPHIARAIIDAGYSYSWEYIFNNIISKDSPAYVHNKNLSLKDGINMLKALNALVVLAHPVLIKNSPFQDIALSGFHGIEANYYQNTSEDTRNFIEFSKKNNLLICGGSDFHGNGKGDKKHGYIGEISPNQDDIKSFLKALNLI